MIDRKVYARWSVVLGLFFSTFGVGFADTAPSAIRSARLTYSDGFVHVDRAENLGSQTAGDPAQLNMPLMEGQTVVTGPDGQAEVEFEDGSLARLTPNSSMTLAHLTADGSGGFRTHIVLGNGLAYFELRSASKLSYIVAAGSDRINPVENTTFRVNLDEAPAAIAVLNGTAHVERAGSYAMDLRAGESFRGDNSEPGRYFLTQEIAPDSWDQWNESRDQMAADAASQNTAVRNGFAGTQGYGWSDLDANGHWYDVPGQGQVWQPEGGEAEDFDPYGNGSWVWYQNAGYVWASGYSWGWTPFRCGGWSYWNTFGWGWTPNAGCGGFGFAGFGYGYYGGYGGRFNVLLPPRHYGGHPFPPPGRSGVHPIVPVHREPPHGNPVGMASGPRMIAGVVARPLTPVGASYTARGGSAVGSSLRRDFPIDRTSRTAVLGVQPGQAMTRQSFVSGPQPVRTYTPNLQRSYPSVAPQPSGAPNGMYRSSGTVVPPPYARSMPQQSAPRIPQYLAPRMAAPPAGASRPVMAAPSAPSAPRTATPSGGGKK